MIARTSMYALVSAGCMILHNGTMIVADYFGLSVSVAVVLSFTIVVIIGYCSHAHLTFRVEPGIAGFCRYSLVMLANIPLAIASIWLLRVAGGFPMFLAAPLSSAALLLVNYSLSRWALHSHSWASSRSI